MAKQDIGDLEVLRKTIQSWLAEKLHSGDDLQLGELKFPEESGESSVTLLLDVQRGGQSERLVFRMKPIDSQVFDSHDLALQYRLMEIIGEAGVSGAQATSLRRK